MTSAKLPYNDEEKKRGGYGVFLSTKDALCVLRRRIDAEVVLTFA
jgi:hypothetical protein